MSKTTVLDNVTRKILVMNDDEYYDLTMDNDGNVYEPGRYTIIDVEF